MSNLSEKDEVFCQEFVLNDGDASKAFRVSRPESTASDKGVWEQASRLLSRDKVKARIEELRAKALVKAEKKFSISVEWRLKKLKEITEAGLSVYHDQTGNKRRENLAASRAAIETMNSMLGVTDAGDKERKSYQVVLRVEDASRTE